jgi:hypothetical protein
MLEIHIQTDINRKGKQVAAVVNRENTCLLEVSLVIQELERTKLSLLNLEFDGEEELEYEKEER